MTTPARKLAELFSEECHGGYRDEALVESYCDVIEWLLAEQRKDLEEIDFDPKFGRLFSPGAKYGPPKLVTKDERIAKLRRALKAVVDYYPGSDLLSHIDAALREDDEDGGTG